MEPSRQFIRTYFSTFCNDPILLKVQKIGTEEEKKGENEEEEEENKEKGRDETPEKEKIEIGDAENQKTR